MPIAADFLLTSAQVLRAIRELDGEALALRTLADWASRGLVVPHQWPKDRGRFNARGYSLANLAAARLVVRLRRLRVSMEQIRAIMRRADVQEALRPSSRAELVIVGTRVHVRHPGAAADLEVPSNQFVLRFADVLAGNERAAELARQSA